MERPLDREGMETSRPVLGWREWVALPDLGIETIKAKVDTGARTSSLHVHELEEFGTPDRPMVRFKVHSEQRTTEYVVKAEAPLHDKRQVKSSNGQMEIRSVILTTLEVLGIRTNVELTLTSRDEMGFRMLLGRQATRRRFLVDPGASYLNGRRAKGTRRLKKKTGNKKGHVG